MAEVSFNFTNIVGSKKCAVSSPRIVSLEIGDESPKSSSESGFREIFLNEQVCHDVKNKSNLICGCDKQSDKNSLIHSQSSLSTSTCDDRPSDKIKSTSGSNIDFNLSDLLNSDDLGRTVESGASIYNSNKTTSYVNMKIIPEVGICNGLSDLLSSFAHDTSKTDKGGSTFEYCESINTRDCDMGLLDIEIPKNRCSKSDDSSLKAEGNLSDLLSSINIEDSYVSKVGSFDSRNMCYSEVSDKSEKKNELPVADLSDLLSSVNLGSSDEAKVGNCNCGNLSSYNSSSNVECYLSDLLSAVNIEDSIDTKFGSFDSKNMCNSKVEKPGNKPPVADLSDILSSIDLGDSKESKVASCKLGNMEVLETNSESCLADLLSSINTEDSGVTKKSNFNSKSACTPKVAEKSKMEKEPAITDLSDLLSSIDLGDSNDSNFNCGNMSISETKSETCLADLLSSINIDKSNKPASAILNSKPLSFGSSNLYLKDTNGVSDSFNELIFDIGSSSSSNSCSSSYSEKENDSSKESSTKNNLLTDKVFESDSGYSSFDSADKGFSFFDYSSDNQFSFSSLLTKKSDTSKAVKNSDSEDDKISIEEMSMSDLMTIVSPEFKNPVLASLNKAEKCIVNKDNSSMQNLIECLNINDSPIVSNNLVEYDEKLVNYDCVDGRISDNVQSEIETVNTQDVASGKDDISKSRNDFVNDDEQITFIDLRECIKSAEHQFTPSSFIKQNANVENQKPECFSPSKILFYHEDTPPSDLSKSRSNPFEFNDVVQKKKPKVNTKQTLFSKVLACKPKKDHALLQKVANIKNELLNNIIRRPVLIDCELPQPIVESVIQSDRCILSNVGRRSFGIDSSCELL